jgi:hypothetical protein
VLHDALPDEVLVVWGDLQSGEVLGGHATDTVSNRLVGRSIYTLCVLRETRVDTVSNRLIGRSADQYSLCAS